MKVEYIIFCEQDSGDPQITGARIELDGQTFLPSVGTVMCFGGPKDDHLQFPVEKVYFDPISNVASVDLSLKNYRDPKGLMDESTREAFCQDMLELQQRGWLIISTDDFTAGKSRKSH